MIYTLQNCDISDPKIMWRVLTSLGLAKPKMSSPLHFFANEELAKYYLSIATTSVSCFIEDLAEAIDDINTVKPLFSHVPFHLR